MLRLSAPESIVLATALTAIRVAIDREQAGLSGARRVGNVSGVIVAGAIATFGVSVAERAAPGLTRGFAALVLLTSALVNGGALADTVIDLTGRTNTRPTS